MNTNTDWAGRHVLVTGHTGFKGSWLTMWLAAAGARVHGFALDPPTNPSLFEVARVSSLLESEVRADLEDVDRVSTATHEAQPEVVFHLAAQPIVRVGYADPIGTIRTNTLGTAHVLEAVKAAPSVRAAVIVSTDKVYTERTDGRPHVESDRLGGPDPYSASKAAAELLVDCYRESYFGRAHEETPRVGTARAGNVIGGGDWAHGRLVPDCIRSFEEGTPVRLRYPRAVRPWQHVLEPISGYVQLAERLLAADGHIAAHAWNFAPAPEEDVPTLELAGMVAKSWGGEAEIQVDDGSTWPETATLRLDATRASRDLGWRQRWPLARAVELTVDWYRARSSGADMLATSLGQIQNYQRSDIAA